MEPAIIDLYINNAWYVKEKPLIAINGLSLTVRRGETVTVTGPSGTGKTTLLSIIAGLHKRFEGKLETNGAVALIPQKDCLPPFYTVYDNISLIARAKGRKPDKAKVAALLDELGLTGLGKQYPAKLSGGQYRRVALGQALYAESDIILMDEPFTALDSSAKTAIIGLFTRLQRERNTAAVFVTHDMAEAEALGGRIVRLRDE